MRYSGWRLEIETGVSEVNLSGLADCQAVADEVVRRQVVLFPGAKVEVSVRLGGVPAVRVSIGGLMVVEVEESYTFTDRLLGGVRTAFRAYEFSGHTCLVCELAAYEGYAASE